jgi:23S rRNA pseudouridine2605 synthase
MKRKTDNFSKFINRKSKAAVKEEIRQERKLVKKERREAVEKHFEEKRNKRTALAEKTARPMPSSPVDKPPIQHKAKTPAEGAMLPLNKYIAHAGVSSRRAAAALVKEGKVTVNGVAVTDPGTKVLYTDTVKVSGKKITVSSHFVYILLNKPIRREGNPFSS